MTLSQTRSIVENKMAIGGKSIVEHNEILGLDAALKYINTTLINRYVSHHALFLAYINNSHLIISSKFNSILRYFNLYREIIYDIFR